MNKGKQTDSIPIMKLKITVAQTSDLKLLRNVRKRGAFEVFLKSL